MKHINYAWIALARQKTKHTKKVIKTSTHSKWFAQKRANVDSYTKPIKSDEISWDDCRAPEREWERRCVCACIHEYAGERIHTICRKSTKTQYSFRVYSNGNGTEWRRDEEKCHNFNVFARLQCRARKIVLPIFAIHILIASNSYKNIGMALPRIQWESELSFQLNRESSDFLHEKQKKNRPVRWRLPFSVIGAATVVVIIQFYFINFLSSI